MASKKITSRRGVIAAVLIIALVLLAAGALFLPRSGKQLEKQDFEQTPPSGAAPALRDDGIVNFVSADGVLRTGITVEIAASVEEQTRGLMGRTSMAEMQGMLFIFARDEARSFWMANTPLPLDILFAAGDGEIVKIHRRTTPLSLESLESGRPARYVVEVNAGFCERHGINEGDRVVYLKN